MEVLPPVINPSRMFLDLSRRVMGVSLKFNTLIGSYLDLSKVLLITAIALSCLAFVASLVLNNYLFVSISLTLCSVSAYAYKLHHDLNRSHKEQERLKDYILDTEQMRASIARLEALAAELNVVNASLQTKLNEAFGLVKFSEEMMLQVEGKIDSSAVETIKQLDSHKEVVRLWLKQIQTGLDDQGKVIEGAANRVMQMLSVFSVDQHIALESTLKQLQVLEEKVSFSNKILNKLELDIAKGQDRLEELHLQIQTSTKAMQTSAKEIQVSAKEMETSAKAFFAGLDKPSLEVRLSATSSTY